MRTARFAAKFCLVLALVLAASCSRHEDGDLVVFPVLVQSPAPDSVLVTAAPSVPLQFDMTWFVSDVSQVQFYRVYGLDFSSGVPDLVLIDSTSVQTFSVIALIPEPILGVSSVSTGNVESAITFGTAP